MKIYRVANYQEFGSFLERTHEAYLEHEKFLEALKPREDRHFTSRGFSYPAGQEVEFLSDFAYFGGFPNVNWRERVVCPVTQLNNRMRAAIQIFDLFSNTFYTDKIYIMEQMTPLYTYLKQKYTGLIGSEYLGDVVPLGQVDSRGLRNEDATKLTFSAGSVSSAVSFDVFEHIFQDHLAFQECFRVLKPNGTLFFTVPFDPHAKVNLERAVVTQSGEIQHILPPEYHGNPLSNDGILSFRLYGWSLLDSIRNVGFEDVFAMLFNSVMMGYYTNQIIFYARKPR
jgi:SAM-dependent methyltransferase